MHPLPEERPIGFSAAPPRARQAIHRSVRGTLSTACEQTSCCRKDPCCLSPSAPASRDCPAPPGTCPISRKQCSSFTPFGLDADGDCRQNFARGRFVVTC